MAKTKTVYFCQNCGAQAPKWIGRCPSCNEWNTYVEEIIQKSNEHQKVPASLSVHKTGPKRLMDIESGAEERIDTKNQELNRVLGGGLVKGSVVLVGGEPGIGKSTLLLQIAAHIADLVVLYITGEESEHQIRLRGERIGMKNDNCYILAETNTQKIFQAIEKLKPQFVIIDSIQTLNTDYIESSAGSISQIRECTAEFNKFAKLSSIPVVLIGHITKEGSLAGPKVLEHMVDTVLQFEGERNYGYRILRATKNRFGSTSELGIYEMHNTGLSEVLNPSEVLLSTRDQNLSGIAISAMMEGNRPMLIEIQALVSSSAYGTPIRSSTGFDTRRLNMLLAVLEKRSGFKLGVKDVFLNIAGGIRVDDPAIDLAVVAAVLSSSEDIAIDQNICFAAEVGLSGEIRSVNKLEQRIAEADKLGLEQVFVSRYNMKGINPKQFNIEIIPVGKANEVFSKLFG